MSQSIIDALKLEVEHWKMKYEIADKVRNDDNERCYQYAYKVGELGAKLRYAEYRLEKSRREYALFAGTYRPEWPEMSRWEISQSHKDNPEYIVSIPSATKSELKTDNEDILSLFKQSSNSI